jgi:hypothetical protein
VREKVPFLPESGQPGPRMEEIVKDQFGGRMRRGLGCARVVVRPTRARAVVVYLIADVGTRDQVGDQIQLKRLFCEGTLVLGSRPAGLYTCQCDASELCNCV